MKSSKVSMKKTSKTGTLVDARKSNKGAIQASSSASVANRKRIIKRKPNIKPIAEKVEIKSEQQEQTPSARTSKKAHTQQNSTSKLPANVVNMLYNLKQEYDKIDNNNQSQRPQTPLLKPTSSVDKDPPVPEARSSFAKRTSIESRTSTQKRDSTTIDKSNTGLTRSSFLSNNSTNWSERSKAVKEKLDEIMRKHTQTLKNLTSIYHTPLGANNKTISNRYNGAIQSMKNPSTASSTISTHTRESFIAPKQTSVVPITRMAKTIPSATTPVTSTTAKRSVSVSRYNQVAIQKVTEKKESITTTKKSVTVNSLMPIRDEIKALRDKVDHAIRAHKTFTVCGNYYTIRHALLQRGWVEKLSANYCPANVDVNFFKRLQTLAVPELSIGLRDKDSAHLYRQVILSKMVGNLPVSLYWDLNRDTYRHNAENLKDCLINFINKNRFNYANKQGLCECAKFAYWWNNPGVSYLRTPRAYSLVNNGDPDEFIQDFKGTAAMSMLKWIVYTHENNVSRLISDAGKVPLTYFHFALRECANFARKLKHEDIDKDIPMAPDREWQIFLDYFYKAVHVGTHFKQSGLETEMSLVHKSKTMLNKLREIFPYLDMDGYMNIWILKPSYGSRGLGIHFCRTLQYVLKVIRENKNCVYVIQKYIERPLLIYNTKFDIRQWFLISSTQPLTIWIYKECYLRFSSQTYNLRKLHESIHLTNNSVQSKYHNGNRDICLPFHNMWFLKEFKAYLENIGYPDAFERVIFPGMKESILSAILTTQDSVYRTPKAFELHGADFMITEDFKPWLIEINSKPALNPSTLVTAKLCPMVLEDVIKVVVDHARNPRAPTGNFEMIYRENVVPLPQTEAHKLRLEGRPIGDNYFMPPEELKRVGSATTTKTRAAVSTDSLNVITTADYMKYVGDEMKKTLQHLLSIIEKERQRRKNTNNNNGPKEPAVVQVNNNNNNKKDKVEKEKDPKETEDTETLKYCQNMQKIQSNMQEIEEIFRQDIFNKAVSEENVCEPVRSPTALELVNATDGQLKSNSRVITKALNVLDKKGDGHVVSSVMRIVSGLSFTNETKKR